MSEGARRERLSRQPAEGLLGLVVVALLWTALLFAWGDAASTVQVLGVVSLYALPAATVVALWWEDWPGSALRVRWAGLVDLALVAAAGVVLALVGQTVVQRLDPGALFTPDVGRPHLPASPALLPLGIAVFTTMLQITLVNEGAGLRRHGRIRGGLAALAVSWVVGLALERGLVGSGLVASGVFTAVLALVSGLQVLGWVVLHGAPVSRIRRRTERLLAANAVTVLLGLLLFAVARPLLRDDATVGVAGAAVVGAGLVTGMLFDTWPTHHLRPVPGAAAALAVTGLLAAVGFVVCRRLAPSVLGLTGPEAAGWASYALNTVATATILHVGVFRRWPLPAPRGPDEGPA